MTHCCVLSLFRVDPSVLEGEEVKDQFHSLFKNVRGIIGVLFVVALVGCLDVCCTPYRRLLSMTAMVSMSVKRLL